MPLRSYWVLCVAGGLALTGVSGCDDTIFGTKASTLYRDCDREPPLTYDNFGKGFLGLHCTGCHSSLLKPEQRNLAPEGVDFDTLKGVLTWAERIEDRTLAQTMPPSGGPTPEELDRVAEWLACEVLPLSAQAGL